MILEQGFVRERNITECHVEKRFVSKKNRVHLVRAVLGDGREQHFVVKEYLAPGSVAGKEADLLAALRGRGLSVPELYYRGEKSIVMEYIRGATLVDILTDAEYYAGKDRDYLNINGLAQHLGRWLHGFYKAAREITGRDTILKDINLRNFLLGYRLYGVDFEDCREGCIEEDIGRLYAFIITYDPAFTPFKVEFAREMYRTLEGRIALDKDRVFTEALMELDSIRQRRGI